VALAVIAAVLLLGRDGSDERRPSLPKYPGASELAPRQVVRAYVEAVGEHDGKRFCALVAPYIAGRYDLVLRDPDDGIPGVRGCADYVGRFIGRTEDCAPRLFRGARLVAIDDLQRRGELRVARARIRVRWEDTCRDRTRTKTLLDHVWLAQLDGAWRVAKLGELADAASLVMARRREETSVPGDARPEAPPDVEAEQLAFSAWADSFEQSLDEREADFRPPGEPESCTGGVSIGDDRNDQTLEGVAAHRRDDAPHLPAADLIGMDVAAEQGTVCVRWRLGGEVDPPFELTYSHLDRSSGYSATFLVELLEDGSARVSAERDVHGDPIALPAEVGSHGNAVSMVLDPESFEKSRPYESPHTPPQLESFAVGGDVGKPLTGPESVHDPLGRLPGSAFSYPTGRACKAGC